MQAIETRYLGPTDTKGSRVTARCDAGRIAVSWNYALGIEENHRAAAEALRVKLGWGEEHYGKIISGSTRDGYVHIMTGRES